MERSGTLLLFASAESVGLVLALDEQLELGEARPAHAAGVDGPDPQGVLHAVDRGQGEAVVKGELERLVRDVELVPLEVGLGTVIGGDGAPVAPAALVIA